MKTKASYISVHSGQVFFFFWWGGVRLWCQVNYRKNSGFGCQNYGWRSRNLYTNHIPVAVQWQSPYLGFHGRSHFDLLYTSPCFLRRRQWHPTPVLLPGKSRGRRSLVGLQSMGSLESDTTERLPFHFSLSCIGEGNGNPLQCSCLENPRDRGAWWAAVYGVAQSRTQLKQLSSSMLPYLSES